MTAVANSNSQPTTKSSDLTSNQTSNSSAVGSVFDKAPTGTGDPDRPDGSNSNGLDKNKVTALKSDGIHPTRALMLIIPVLFIVLAVGLWAVSPIAAFVVGLIGVVLLALWLFIRWMASKKTKNQSNQKQTTNKPTNQRSPGQRPAGRPRAPGDNRRFPFGPNRNPNGDNRRWPFRRHNRDQNNPDGPGNSNRRRRMPWNRDRDRDRDSNSRNRNEQDRRDRRRNPFRRPNQDRDKTKPDSRQPGSTKRPSNDTNNGGSRRRWRDRFSGGNGSNGGGGRGRRDNGGSNSNGGRSNQNGNRRWWKPWGGNSGGTGSNGGNGDQPRRRRWWQTRNSEGNPQPTPGQSGDTPEPRRGWGRRWWEHLRQKGNEYYSHKGDYAGFDSEPRLRPRPQYRPNNDSPPEDGPVRAKATRLNDEGTPYNTETVQPNALPAGTQHLSGGSTMSNSNGSNGSNGRNGQVQDAATGAPLASTHMEAGTYTNRSAVEHIETANNLRSEAQDYLDTGDPHLHAAASGLLKRAAHAQAVAQNRAWLTAVHAVKAARAAGRRAIER